MTPRTAGLRRVKTAILTITALACVGPLGAQITAALSTNADGTPQIVVRNDSDVALEAFAFSASHASNDYPPLEPIVVWVDPALRTYPAVRRHNKPVDEAQPLAPGKEFVWTSGFMMRTKDGPAPLRLEQVVVAGIFSDGATAGNPALLTRLLDRRNNMLLAVEMSLDILLNAGAGNTAPDALIKQFELMAESARRSYAPPEQKVGLGLYRSMVGKLMDLRAGADGSPFPPTDFVASETKRLNRQRVELSALVASQPHPMEWARLGGDR